MRHLLAALGLAFASIGYFQHSPAQAEITECTEITSLPTTITASGIYCLKGNLGTNINAGVAVSIEANNVVIDLNGWRIGGLAAGNGSLATAFSSTGRKNITIRNGIIRGFAAAVAVTDVTSFGHRYENLQIDGAKSAGIIIVGSNHFIRDNQMFNIGLSSVLQGAAGILGSGGLLNGTTIERNSIAGVAETSTSNGIRLSAGGVLNIIRNNTIRNIVGSAADVGIILGNSSDIIIQGNRVLNNESNQGASGISVGGSQNVICADNIVDGFGIAIVGCNTNSNNITP